MSFTKNLVFIWYQGYSKLTRQVYLQNVQNWARLNPEWTVKVYDNESLQSACAQLGPEFLTVYNSFKKMHQKIDFGRYVVLYLYGGVSVDMDQYALRPIGMNTDVNNFINKANSGSPQGALGLSMSEVSTAEAMLYSRQRYILGNAVILVTPKNKLLLRYIQKVAEKVLRDTKIDHSINATTGPHFFNEFFYRMSVDGVDRNTGTSITVFPSEIFEPCDLQGQCRLTDNTVSLHKYELSWLSPRFKHLAKKLFEYKSFLYGVIAAILLVIIWSQRKFFVSFIRR